MTRSLPVIAALLALSSCSTAPPASKESKATKPSPPARETAFKGYTNTGVQKFDEPKGHLILFLDPAGPPPDEPAAPSGLLESVAADGTGLRSGLENSIGLLPEMFRSIDKKPVNKMTFIASYPMEAVTLPARPNSKETYARAKPGKLQRLAQVAEQFGQESERQSWTGAPYKNYEMEGVVHWWGDVGVKAGADGAITHVLLRGRPKEAETPGKK